MHMQQRSEETHNRILSAAQAVFARQGYEAAGVAEICEAAGVSKGAFYHHFPSKQAVFLELLQTWLKGLEARLEEARQEPNDTPQTLIQMTQRTQDVFQSADGRLSMFLEFWMQASRDPIFWEATIAPYHRYQAFFTRLVQDGIADGSLRAVDPAMASRVIIALAVGVLLQGLLDPQGADWEDVARQGMQYLMAGVAAEPRPPSPNSISESQAKEAQ